LIESVKSVTLLFGDMRVGRDGADQSRGQWSVDAFKEFQKQHGESIAVGEQPVATRMLDFLDQPFRTQFGQIVAERGEPILLGRSRAAAVAEWRFFVVNVAPLARWAKRTRACMSAS